MPTVKVTLALGGGAARGFACTKLDQLQAWVRGIDGWQIFCLLDIDYQSALPMREQIEQQLRL